MSGKEIIKKQVVEEIHLFVPVNPKTVRQQQLEEEQINPLLPPQLPKKKQKPKKEELEKEIVTLCSEFETLFKETKVDEQGQQEDFYEIRLDKILGQYYHFDQLMQYRLLTWNEQIELQSKHDEFQSQKGNEKIREKYFLIKRVIQIINKLCIYFGFINFDIYKNYRYNPELLRVLILDMYEINSAFINIETL